MNLAASNTTFSPQAVDMEELIAKRDTNYGLLIAMGILNVWAASLITLFSLDLTHVPVWVLPVAVLWQMFLYTGLFITAHDAMHGSVSSHVRINHFVGALAVLVYGLFSYRELLQKHWLHHHYPASDRDPDFHNGQHTHPVLWYLCFMSRYWSWQRFTGLLLIYQFAHIVLHLSNVNLLLFWILPSILSSVQLFYFGTFLTHQEPAEGFNNCHRTQSNPLPVLWSFITCYHFGYHEEHHEHPHISWWQLPSIHRASSQHL